MSPHPDVTGIRVGPADPAAKALGRTATAPGKEGLR